MNDFTSWMENNRSNKHQWLCKRMTFNNGVSVSVQAGEHAYCHPRVNIDYSMYSEFELGFPSEVIEELLLYAEDMSDPTETVYGYVPKQVVQQMIIGNGGIKE